MKLKISVIADYLRLAFIIILIGAVLIYIRKQSSNLLNLFSGPAYETVFITDTLEAPKPDTVIKWLEKITQVPMKPETVYKYITYSEPLYHTMRMVKSDGKHIEIQTQYGQTPTGQRFIYPYCRKWQAVPSKTSINFIRYRDIDLFTWQKLILRYDYLDENALKLGTRLHFNPLKLTASGWGGLEGFEANVELELF